MQDLARLLKLPMAEARKAWSSRLGFYPKFELERHINGVLGDLLENNQLEIDKDLDFGYLLLEFHLYTPDHRTLNVNRVALEIRKKKVEEWNTKVLKVFQDTYRRLSQILINEEYWIFPYDDATTNPIQIMGSEFIRQEGNLVEINRMRVGLKIDRNIIYKIYYILFQLFISDKINYSAKLNVLVSHIDTYTKLLSKREFTKNFKILSLENMDKIEKFREFLTKPIVIDTFSSFLVHRFPMFIMNLRELEYYMKNFMGEPIFFHNREEFISFTQNLRQDERILELFYSANDDDVIVRNLFFEFDPSALLTRRYGLDRIWHFQCALTDIILNYLYLYQYDLKLKVSYSGNKSMHIQTDAYFDFEMADEFYESFFKVIDYKNCEKQPIIENYNHPNTVTMLICLGLGIKMRNELGKLISYVFDGELPSNVLKFYIHEKNSREMGLAYDVSPNKFRGQFRTYLSLHRGTMRLKVPFVFKCENGICSLEDVYRDINYVKRYSELDFWDDFQLMSSKKLLDPQMDYSERNKENTLKVLYSVLPEIFVAVKFGNKEIDFMTDEELSGHVTNADLLLKDLDFEYQRIELEKEWLTAMVEMSVMY